MVIGVLHVNTWKGMSVGARHWYAKLWITDLEDPNNYQFIQLERKLTGREIRTENLEAGYERVMKGATTEGFDTEADGEAFGINRFKSQYKGVLFRGSGSAPTPWDTVIVWPPFVEREVVSMNALGMRFRSLNGHDGTERKRAERLDKRWYRLYNTLRLKCKL
jgi:hypothetical protein